MPWLAIGGRRSGPKDGPLAGRIDPAEPIAVIVGDSRSETLENKQADILRRVDEQILALLMHREFHNTGAFANFLAQTRKIGARDENGKENEREAAAGVQPDRNRTRLNSTH